MKIRTARPEDLNEILAIYEKAREYMRNSGNPNQWGTTNPPAETLIRDIEIGQLYVVYSDAAYKQFASDPAFTDSASDTTRTGAASDSSCKNSDAGSDTENKEDVSAAAYADRIPSMQDKMTGQHPADSQILLGSFACIGGKDPTYSRIDGGEWLNDLPYLTLHRVASAGIEKGVLNCIIEWTSQRSADIRVDTHHDNRTMQHLLEKYGFTKCGIIYLENGDPRIAYHRHRSI